LIASAIRPQRVSAAGKSGKALSSAGKTGQDIIVAKMESLCQTFFVPSARRRMPEKALPFHFREEEGLLDSDQKL
jgi:hypothetical protein